MFTATKGKALLTTTTGALLQLPHGSQIAFSQIKQIH